MQTALLVGSESLENPTYGRLVTKPTQVSQLGCNRPKNEPFALYSAQWSRRWIISSCLTLEQKAELMMVSNDTTEIMRRGNLRQNRATMVMGRQNGNGEHSCVIAIATMSSAPSTTHDIIDLGFGDFEIL